MSQYLTGVGKPQLESLLRTECLLRPVSAWLFRVASDGLAHEVRNLRVRPGETYVFARTGPITNADLPSISLSCEGISAVFLELPEILDARWEINLQQLGLKQPKTIEVWPAGLTPAQWDNDGHGEWLASEMPCLGVCADHSVSAIVVAISSGLDSPLVLDNTHPGMVSFVELPQLPVGLHTIRFSTRRANSNVADPVGDLEVLMRIRESRPWSQSGCPQGPLLVRVEPINPTMEQLWEGQAEIAFQGPTGRQLKCTASLLDSTTESAKAKILPPLSLPVDASTWASHFNRYFRDDRGIATAYDTARACELSFTADELGAFTIRCERELTPLRWALRDAKTGYQLRLMNDSGSTVPPVIARRPFERPHFEETLNSATEFAIPASGGLYIARLPSQVAAIIAPPVVQGLQQFGCNPTVAYGANASEALPKAWEDAELWGNAKVTGNMFGTTRQREVLRAIEQYIMRRLCGDDWSRTEAAYYDGSKSLAYLQREVWRANHEAEIAERFRRQHAVLRTLDMSARIREMEWVARHLEGPNSQIHDSVFEWLAEFVLRVASDPVEVKSWAGDRLGEGINYLLRLPTFVRAARFLVVVIDRELNERSYSHELYGSWRWR